MSVAQVSSVGASQQGLGQLGGNVKEIQDRFIKLLVAQLKNQDPMEPTDNAEITSQMAQLNTVSGIQALNDQMKTLTDLTANKSLMDAVGLAGRKVLVEGRVGKLESGRPMEAAFELPFSADDIQVSIRDGANREVYSSKIGPHREGVHSIEWDGVNANGDQLSAGNYQVVVTAINGETRTELTTLTSQTVESVQTADGEVILNTDAGSQYTMSEVRRFY